MQKSRETTEKTYSGHNNFHDVPHGIGLKSILTSIVFFLVAFFSVVGCSSHNPKISDTDRCWLEKFFSDVFLEEGAIFCLLGSKPITQIHLSYCSEEENAAFYALLSDEEKEKCVLLENYDLPKNFQKWLEFQKGFQLRKFLFFERPNPAQPQFPSLIFVNIANTRRVLDENYELFRSLTEEDFNLEHIVEEIVNSDSKFWNKVFDNGVLSGIIFGFGRENAECFERSISGQEISKLFSDYYRLGKSSIEDFPIPVFASFVKNDPVITAYQEEKEKIKKICKGEDFVTVIFQKLFE